MRPSISNANDLGDKRLELAAAGHKPMPKRKSGIFRGAEIINEMASCLPIDNQRPNNSLNKEAISPEMHNEVDDVESDHESESSELPEDDDVAAVSAHFDFTTAQNADD